MDNHNIDDTGRFEARAFGRDALIYSAGNGLLILFGFVQVLILPKYLSVIEYGYYQLFMLYGLYVGILNLGFLDGILLRWAGKELRQIDGEIRIALTFLVIEQLIVIIPLGVITYFILRPPFQTIGLMIFINAFILNIASFFIVTAQAIRQFRLITVLEVGRGFSFLALIILLFVSGYLEFQYVIMAWLAAYLLYIFVFSLVYRRYLAVKFYPVSALIYFGKNNINVGIFILLGNFVFLLFWSMDRLLVSSFFTIAQFAVYAFAATMSQIAFIFIKAVADVLFPHLSAAAPELRIGVYRVSKQILILCWAAFLAAYFPLAALIESYLPQYVGSLPIIKILMGMVGFSSLILILHVNYYRIYRKQRQYFIVGAIALALAVLLILIAIKLLGTLISVSIAILISFVIWYILNGLSLRQVTGESGRKVWQDLIVVGVYYLGFWLSSFLSDKFILQMLIYVGILCVITWILLRKEVKELALIAKKLRN